jgi:DNA topoisomerase IA
VRPQNSHALEKSLGAELKVLHGCGHLINLESPDEFNDLLLGHIKQGIKRTQLNQRAKEESVEEGDEDDDEGDENGIENRNGDAVNGY